MIQRKYLKNKLIEILKHKQLAQTSLSTSNVFYTDFPTQYLKQVAPLKMSNHLNIWHPRQGIKFLTLLKVQSYVLDVQVFVLHHFESFQPTT